MLAGRARLRAALAAGTAVYGTFLKLPGPDAVELAAVVGLDLCVVDLEHSQLSEGEARDLIRHAAALGLPALVRLPAVDPGLINRLLEAGAAGIQLSTLRSAAETAALRTAVGYPPGGRRSLSLAHPAAGYGAASLAEYLAAEREIPPVLVGQIETPTTDDPLAEVVAGLDVVFIGVTDLAVSLGRGAFDARVAEIRSVDAVVGSWCASPAAAAEAVAAGDRYVVVGSDLQLLTQAMRGLGQALGKG